MSTTQPPKSGAKNNGMKAYAYKVRSRDGRLVEGKTRATSRERVAEFLTERGYYPLSVQEVSGLQRDFSFGEKRVKLKEISAFMRQFATMIGAGLPLLRALGAMRDQQANPTLRGALTRVGNDVETGSSFADGIAKYPQIFPPVVISMVRAGESGGFLEQSLQQVATNLEAQVKLTGKIRSAMTYPVAIFILAILIVTAMLLFIVPVFANLFSGLGGELPLPTRILIWLSDGIKFGGIPLIILLIVAFVVWRRNKHREGWRSFADPIKLKIPVFGRLVQLLTSARFARNFGNLLNAGLPVMQALDIVGATSGSIVVERALDGVKARVSTGELIAPQLAQNKVFPRMLTEMMAVGEEAGEIPQMMEKIANAYDDEVDAMTESLASLIEPIMLVFLGILVGGVVIALYLPIFDIYSLISKQ